jgi:hypothetical protein
MNNKSCGGCKYFVKLVHMKNNGGLCEWFDSRTNADFGHECSAFKALKYDRLKEKREAVKEVKEEIEDV